MHNEYGPEPSLNRTARAATIHCLTGCGIGEVAGMAIGTAAGLSTTPTVVLSIILAFFFGYLLTVFPLIRSGVGVGRALGLAFASDTVSIVVMEIVDNALMMVIPGAMDAGLTEALFWVSLVVSLGIAGLVAFPIVRFLIARGRGHAVVHKYHASTGPDSAAHSPHH